MGIFTPEDGGAGPEPDCGVAPGSSWHGVAKEGAKPFRILVCNDDGVRSEGIAALARELAKIGEVHVVAPLENRSGASHAIEFIETGQVRAYLVYRDGELFGHGVTGTPVDAALTGIFGLHSDVQFDLVVSGINFGNNAGMASMYSGTVRDEGLRFFEERTGSSAEFTAAIVDRIAATPAQTCPYKIGMLAFFRLRDRMRRALGDGFDIRRFHDTVLEHGSLPLEVLEDVVGSAITAVGESAARERA